MRAILIPVKRFASAKTRLSPHFSAAARSALAAALCEDMFETVSHVRGIDKIFVVSSEKFALDGARQRGWEALEEVSQISESASVDAASTICAGRGVRALLRLPADLPLLEPSDILPLFEALGPTNELARAAVIVPSRERTGTNALLRTPPDLFASHFGPGSFEKHLGQAARCGAAIKVVHNPHIAWDVDELADLEAIRGRLRPQSATAQWLARHAKLGGRVKPAHDGGGG